MEKPSEQHQAAQQAITEINADLGPAFLLETVAIALEQQAPTEKEFRGDSLRAAAGILRNLAEMLAE